MQLEKSYRLINFMNRGHSRWLTEMLAGLGWLGCMIATGSQPISDSLRHEFRRGDLKVAFRRAGWITKTSWVKINPVPDHFFFFTEGLDTSGLDKVDGYLEARKNKLPEGDYLSDKLYIQAAKLHSAIENREDDEKIQAMENDFYHIADQLLSVIGKLDETPSQVKKSDREGDFSLEDAREALSRLQEVLPNNEFPWYVISGTFLGLHREGGFLKHDYDIDVGINTEDVNASALIRKLAMAPEFAVKKVDNHLKIIKGEGKLYSVQKDIALIKLVHASGINIDIFVHHHEDGVIWHGSSIHRWENTPYDLEERELDGVPVLAPRQADQYLTENYGDWRVPVKNFDCTLSTPNLTITKSFLSVALFIKRLYVFTKTEPLDAQQLKHRLIESCVIREEAGNLYAIKYI